MADDVLKSFAIALGFVTKGKEEAKRSVADYEKAVRDAEKRIEDARWAGAKTEEEVAKLSRDLNLKLAREALSQAQAREKAETEQVRKRKENAAAFVAGMNKMAIAAAAAATAIGFAFEKFAKSFDNLYFQAERSGTSVQSLRAIGFAFGQVGGDAKQAQASVDSFTTKIRNNPGLRQFVKDLGVNDKLQGVDKYIATLDAIKAKTNGDSAVGHQYAEMLGISEENYNLFVRQGEAMKAYKAQYDDLSQTLKFNADQAAEGATKFEKAIGRLQATVGILVEKLLAALAPALTAIIDRFQAWIASNPEALDRILTNISNTIVRVVEGITKFLASLSDSDNAMKTWDAFAERAERIAKSIETIVLGLGKVFKLVSDLNHIELGGIGAGSTWLLNKLTGGTFAPASFGGAGGGGGGGWGSGGPPSADVPDNRSLYEKIAPTSMGGKPAPGRASIGNWWTPERQQHAIDTLVKGGVSELGAKGLVARWSAVEAPGGPGAVNPKSGAFGIGQWLTADRLAPIKGNTDFDAQLGHALHELHTTEGAALRALNAAKTPQDAARGASMYERAEGYNGQTGIDNFTAKTATAIGLLGRAAASASDAMSPAGTRATGTGLTEIRTRSGKSVKVASEFAPNFQGFLDDYEKAGGNVGLLGGVSERPGNASYHPTGRAIDVNQTGRGIRSRDLNLPLSVEDALAQKWGLRSGNSFRSNDNGHFEVNDAAAARAAIDRIARERAGASAAATAPANVAKAGAGRANMTPGGFDVNAYLKPQTPMGVGAGSSTSNTDARSVTQHIHNDMKVTGVEKPQDHARTIESTLKSVHQMSLENAQSAIA